MRSVLPWAGPGGGNPGQYDTDPDTRDALLRVGGERDPTYYGYGWEKEPVKPTEADIPLSDLIAMFQGGTAEVDKVEPIEEDLPDRLSPKPIGTTWEVLPEEGDGGTPAPGFGTLPWGLLSFLSNGGTPDDMNQEQTQWMEQWQQQFQDQSQTQTQTQENNQENTQEVTQENNQENNQEVTVGDTIVNLPPGFGVQDLSWINNVVSQIPEGYKAIPGIVQAFLDVMAGQKPALPPTITTGGATANAYAVAPDLSFLGPVLSAIPDAVKGIPDVVAKIVDLMANVNRGITEGRYAGFTPGERQAADLASAYPGTTPWEQLGGDPPRPHSEGAGERAGARAISDKQRSMELQRAGMDGAKELLLEKLRQDQSAGSFDDVMAMWENMASGRVFDFMLSDVSSGGTSLPANLTLAGQGAHASLQLQRAQERQATSNIGLIDAQTLSESLRAGLLDAQKMRELASAGLIGAQTLTEAARQGLITQEMKLATSRLGLAASEVELNKRQAQYWSRTASASERQAAVAELRAYMDDIRLKMDYDSRAVDGKILPGIYSHVNQLVGVLEGKTKANIGHILGALATGSSIRYGSQILQKLRAISMSRILTKHPKKGASTLGLPKGKAPSNAQSIGNRVPSL